jgi:hypothetical protein
MTNFIVMRWVLIVVFCFFILPLTGLAQSELAGKVLSADNKSPIAAANVYLSNSSVGTITNEQGYFIILNFPAGRYDLVISCIGYETQVLTVSSVQLPPSLTILLKPKVNELQEVIVAPYEKNGWEKWGKFFMDNLIGTSEYADNCKLKNQEVVKFRYDKRKHIISAFADEPLVLENNALGYLLHYTLTIFEFNQNSRIFYFQGYPLFEEMGSKRERQEKRWAANRTDCYYGSMMHFMRCLFRNKLIEQGFEIRKLIRISDEEKARVKKILIDNQSIVLADPKEGIVISSAEGFRFGNKQLSANPDSANYYRKVMRQPDALNVLVNQVLPGDSVAYGIDSVTVGFSFPDALQVIYLHKKPTEAYRKSNPFTDRSVMFQPITSELTRPLKREIVVLENGSYFHGVDLLTSGYWAWSEKLATMLPNNYWPTK